MNLLNETNTAVSLWSLVTGWSVFACLRDHTLYSTHTLLRCDLDDRHFDWQRQICKHIDMVPFICSEHILTFKIVGVVLRLTYLYSNFETRVCSSAWVASLLVSPCLRYFGYFVHERPYGSVFPPANRIFRRFISNILRILRNPVTNDSNYTVCYVFLWQMQALFEYLLPHCVLVPIVCSKRSSFDMASIDKVLENM